MTLNAFPSDVFVHDKTRIETAIPQFTVSKRLEQGMGIPIHEIYLHPRLRPWLKPGVTIDCEKGLELEVGKVEVKELVLRAFLTKWTTNVDSISIPL